MQMERKQGIKGQRERSKSQGWRKRRVGVSVSVYVCVSRPIDRRPSKSKPCAPLPQLHLANEKHHYATLTTTPLRAKMWEQESSGRRGGRGDDFLKDTAPASCTGMMHEHRLLLAHHKTCVYSIMDVHLKTYKCVIHVQRLGLFPWQQHKSSPKKYICFLSPVLFIHLSSCSHVCCYQHNLTKVS